MLFTRSFGWVAGDRMQGLPKFSFDDNINKNILSPQQLRYILTFFFFVSSADAFHE